MRGYIALVFFLVLAVAPLNVNADDSSSYNQKGLNELQIDNLEAASGFFLQAISIDPSQKHYYNNLAAAYIRLREYAKAEESLKKALSIDANYVKALANMSVALFHLGRYMESYNYYIKSKRIDNKYIEGRFDKERISSSIKKMSLERPDDKELKKIRKYIDSNLRLQSGD
jgi:tetratricopeptide (TPR) repeat protein